MQATERSWFAAGYGPFRRLAGGSAEISAKYGPRELRFITLFNDGDSLSDCERWLMDVRFAAIDKESPSFQRSETLFKSIKAILNEYVLPKGVQLDTVNAQGAFFRTPYAPSVPLHDLSDGYRSVIALIIDLMRQLSTAFSVVSADPEGLRHISGVVLIDELDAHLHPVWQREIGFQLSKCFPLLQFIVTTYSPFVPQTADQGGLYILRRSDAQNPATVVVDVEDAQLRGWRADQILTILFDVPAMYDPQTERDLREYARLKILADMGRLSESLSRNYLSPERRRSNRWAEARYIQVSVDSGFRSYSLLS